MRGFLALNADDTPGYLDWCPEILLLSAFVDFHQVPRGSERAAQIRLRLRNFPEETPITATSSEVRVSVAPQNAPVVGEHVSEAINVVVWAFFRAEEDALLGAREGTIELRFDVRHSVTIPFYAEIVDAARTSIALVLDCSTSMNDPRGDDGLDRLQGLKEAVSVCVDVARPGDAISVAPFSTDALGPGLRATVLGSGDDADRTSGPRHTVDDFVQRLRTVGRTSIGDGLVLGQRLLDETTPPGIVHKALIVVTDGYQNEPRSIEEARASLALSTTFAIGIGSAFEDQLRLLAHSTLGTVTIANSPVSAENRYRLEEYLLQALTLASGGEIISDPEGRVMPGAFHRIPFEVSDAEISIDCIVVSDVAPGLFVGIEGPSGEVVSLEEFRGRRGCRVTRTRRVGHVTLSFPSPGLVEPWGPGSWSIVIGHGGGQPKSDKTKEMLEQLSKAYQPKEHPKGPASYLATVHTRSALRFHPVVRKVGEEILLEASLSYAGAAILRDARVLAELSKPLGTKVQLELKEIDPGFYRARISAAEYGQYLARFHVRGKTFAGHLFQRERVLEESFNDQKAVPRVPESQSILDSVRHGSEAIYRLKQKIHRHLRLLSFGDKD